MDRAIPLFFALLVVTSNITTGGEDLILDVRSLTGQSVNLTISHNLTNGPKNVKWQFQNKSGKYKIADIEDNKLQSNLEQFSIRLEMFYNGTVLRISNLTMKDIGVYHAIVTLKDNSMHQISFNVTVYEPILTTSLPPKSRNTSRDHQPNNRNHYPAVIAVVFAILGSLFMLVMCWKREEKYSVEETDTTAILHREKREGRWENPDKPPERPEFIEIHPSQQDPVAKYNQPLTQAEPTGDGGDDRV